MDKFKWFLILCAVAGFAFGSYLTYSKKDNSIADIAVLLNDTELTVYIEKPESFKTYIIQLKQMINKHCDLFPIEGTVIVILNSSEPSDDIGSCVDYVDHENI